MLCIICNNHRGHRLLFLKLGCGIWSTEEAADFLEANVPMDPATALEDAEMYLTCSDQQA